MATIRRSTILIDQKVQGALLLRTVVYWLYCLLSVTTLVFVWDACFGPPRPLGTIVRQLLGSYAPALIGSFILLPIVLVDMIRFSQLFVGPAYRLKAAMDRLADGEPVDRLVLRQSDFWPDMASSFNRLLARTQSSGGRSAAAQPAAAECPPLLLGEEQPPTSDADCSLQCSGQQ